MAGSKRDAFENSILQLIFNNVDIANIGDAAGIQNSAAAGSLWVALFTALPTDSTAGTETVYTNYARVAVARTAGGWTVSGNNASNTAAVTFPTCGTTGATILGFAIMTALTGGDMLYWADLTAQLIVSNGITPEFAAGDIDITED